VTFRKLRLAMVQIAGSRATSIRLVALVSAGALLGKVLGILRELMFARTLGATWTADSFRGAVSIVMLPLLPLQVETVPAVLVPMHQEWQRDECAPQRLAALCAALAMMGVGITLLVEWLGAWWVNLVVGGLSAQAKALTLDFVRIMALAMPASVLLNCLSAGEIALGRSRIVGLQAAVLNLSLLAGIGLYVLTGELMFLPASFAFAFNVFVIWCIWSMRREGLLDFSGIRLRTMASISRDFLRRLRPFLCLPAVQLGQQWIERQVASRSVVGTLASVDYARTLTDSALYLVGQPVGLAVLADRSAADKRAVMTAISCPILAIAVPSSVLLFVFSDDIVRLVFMRGAFDETAVRLTSNVMSGIAVGLWAGTLGVILLRLLNSSGKNWQAALVVTVSFGVNAVLNLVTSRMMLDGNLAALMLGLAEGARGIALLTGVVFALGCTGALSRLLLLVLVPAIAMGAACFAIEAMIASPVLRLLSAGVVCIACIFLALALLMPTEIGGLRRRIIKSLKDGAT
jgi:putative peptidoglycan lipid II flippase